jgi:hypothetical protein
LLTSASISSVESSGFAFGVSLFIRRGNYWITKLVKYSSSRLGSPLFAARIS